MPKKFVETRHIERIAFQMTPAEKKRVARLAKMSKLTLTDTIRAALNSALVERGLKPLELSPTTGAAAYLQAAKDRGVTIPNRGRSRKGDAR